jgi:hypothetical protein
MWASQQMSADNSALDLADGLGLTYHFLVTQASKAKYGAKYGDTMCAAEARKESKVK